jgi:hypothetical protein
MALMPIVDYIQHPQYAPLPNPPPQGGNRLSMSFVRNQAHFQHDKFIPDVINRDSKALASGAASHKLHNRSSIFGSAEHGWPP